MTHRFSVPVDQFDVDLCLRSGQLFRFEPNGDAWTGAEGDNWYRIRREDDELTVESNADQAAFASFARLDWNSVEVSDAIISSGPEMKPYLASMPGLRVLRQSDPVETLFTFLCSANNHVARIGSMVRTLASYGERFSDSDLLRFPRLERLTAISEEELRAKGFGYRGGWISKAATELTVRGGETYLNSLKQASLSDARTELMGLTGVGPKLADCIALFGLDHTGAVPVDTHIWQALTRLYFPNYVATNLTHAKYREVADFYRERFGEYAGWAHQFLFYENHLNWRDRKRAG